jgi:hypothetical protein
MNPMISIRSCPWLVLSVSIGVLAGGFLPGSLRAALTEPAAVKSAAVVSLDGGAWWLAPDPKNVGREEKWWEKPAAGAKATRVPGILQEAFPTYHGVAWYWRELTPPANPHAQGRCLLRFWNVDYLADVWLNGVHVGRHEGACEPFVLDVTDAARPQAVNRLAVRVLNPTNAPIDGIKLSETAHTAKSPEGWAPGRGANWGGITDSVEWIVAPAVRVEDLFVRPDPATGRIQVQANLRNAGKQAVAGRIVLRVAPAASGETLDALAVDRDLPPGDTLLNAELKVAGPHLWQLNDPYLFRVAASVSAEPASSFDEYSTRCGFRDFRLERGYFRLNGKRLFLKSSHTGCEMPVGVAVGLDPDLPRRDLLNCKVMGMNMIRSFTGLSPRRQIELCDELGMLMYQENYAGWFMEASPKMVERFNRSTLAMVKRDRNHPSIVMWGLLNETPNGPVVEQAVAALPLVRALDDTRMVMLNSGGWDGTGRAYANPGAVQWQTDLADQHPYQPLPHDAGVINLLRTINAGQKPYWLSEYGMGSAVDLVRLTRHYEQLGNTACEDAVIYRGFLNQFLADWNRWNLGDTFANPDDYFRQCVAWMAGLRKLGTNAIRANPHVIGHSVTGTQDQGLTGEGLTANIFRELKPGVVDAMFDAFAPLRWCLFVEPATVYRGRKAKLEAVLANEDMLAPGDYPARLQVVGPRNATVFDRTITVKIPDPKGKPEPALAMPVFSEEVAIDGPSGKYRFLATFLKGAAAAGGDVDFYVVDPAEMPKVDAEVVLWGDDPGLEKWLAANGIKTRAFTPEAQSSREVILVGSRPAAGGAEAFGALTRHVARGSHAVFLVPDVFKKDDKNPTCWLPLANKGTRRALENWLYHKDDWAKNHPIFDGLPAGCILDHTVYREVAPNTVWAGQDLPAEVVAGSINTAIGYSSGLTVAVYRLGAGRFTLNTLRIRQHLGDDPVAERLLRNMLRHAARDANQPPADLPADFEAQLKAMGY